jgi:hypothetical protein
MMIAMALAGSEWAILIGGAVLGAGTGAAILGLLSKQRAPESARTTT